MEENIVLEKKSNKVNSNLAIKIANLLFIISVISLVLTAFITFSFLALILYYLILVLILFLTLFTTYSQVMEWFDKGEAIQAFLSTTFQYMPYSIGVGFSATIIALILYITNKKYIHRTAKIITSSVVIALYVVAAVLRFVVFAGN